MDIAQIYAEATPQKRQMICNLPRQDKHFGS